MLRKFRSIAGVAREAFTNLKANDPVRMAGATAFFTFFALPPIVILLSTLFSPVFNQQFVHRSFFHQLSQLLGRQSAKQVRDISQNLQQENSSVLLTLLTGVVIALASTTLFTVIKNSLNQLWNVKAKPDRNFLDLMKDRGIAFTIIIFSGLLLTASLAVEQWLTFSISRSVREGSTIGRWAVVLTRQLISSGVMTVWFALLLHYLPDRRMHWKALWTGALVTSLLYGLGQVILDRLLIHSSVIGSRYGTSGAIILILLFVFYASLIFYYGAAFTRQFARWLQLDAEPKAHSVVYEITEVNDPDSKTP